LVKIVPGGTLGGGKDGQEDQFQKEEGDCRVKEDVKTGLNLVDGRERAKRP